MKEIGYKIRKVREFKGYSQEYVSRKLNISQRAYSKMEREEVKLDWQRINEIAQVLEIDPVDLVTFDDSLIFQNCCHSGKTNNIKINFSNELKQHYEQRITELKSEIEFLRNMVLNNK